MLPVLAFLLLTHGSPTSKSAPIIPLTLDQRIASVLPTAEEDKWRTVGWRVNLMQARDEAQKAHKPVFLWIMVGNPQGCT